MAKITKIIDYQFRKLRESIVKQRKEMSQRHKKRMKEVNETLKQIHNDRAKFERKWFKALKGGKL
jgi:flagellar hook-associated protein FlgK